MRMLQIVILAAALAACASRFDQRLEFETDLVCTADEAVRCPENGCVMGLGGARRTAPVSLDVPASRVDYDMRFCIDGACEQAIRETAPYRAHHWTADVIGHSAAYIAHLDISEGGRRFTLRHASLDYVDTWIGRCQPSGLEPPARRC